MPVRKYVCTQAGSWIPNRKSIKPKNLNAAPSILRSQDQDVASNIAVSHNLTSTPLSPSNFCFARTYISTIREQDGAAGTCTLRCQHWGWKECR
jgi:hypothetical protein